MGIILILIGLSLSIIAFSNKQLRQNLKESVHLMEGSELNQDSDIRLLLWKSGFEIFKENPWFGVGTGDISEELLKKYEKYGLDLANNHHYNVHNQYLDIAIKFGIIGLAIFLSWMVYLFYISIKNKQFLLFYFTLILILNFFFENMLNLIAGVSFFAFFYSLLYVRYNVNS